MTFRAVRLSLPTVFLGILVAAAVVAGATAGYEAARTHFEAANR